MLALKNTSRGEKVGEDFPSGYELLFPHLSSDCKAAFFFSLCNDLKFRERLISVPSSQLLPQLSEAETAWACE